MEQKKKMIGSKSSIVYFLFFMSATAMLILAVIFSLYIRRMEQTVEESVQNHLRAAANYASTFITAEELELFHTVDDMERPEWDEIRGRLMQFAEDNQVLYVYYWRYLGNGQLQYIIDNDEDEDWMVTPELILDVDEDQTTADAVPQILAGETWVSELEVYTSMWGGLFSGVAPVFDADGNVYCAAGVDVSDEIIVYMRNTIRTMQFAMIIALIVSVISGLFGMLLYRRKAIQSTIASITKSQFLSTMSHEIRTPMNAILGITELQLLNDNLDQNVRDGLEKIYTSGDMLLSIINDILDLSKIEAGKLEMLIASYDTSSLISETVQLNVMRIGSKPINFELQIDENLPVFLSGDELRIKQILNNVLSNAFKYTLEGTVSFKISVETATNKDAADEVIVSFTVSDTGQGMTKEQVDKLFDEYSQFNMEANRKTEGTGLGLSITRNLIRMMKGTIAIESEAEKGSVFTIRLPQGKIGDDVLGAEAAKNLQDFRTSSRAQMKHVKITRESMPYGSVLIIDDVETNIFVASGLMVPYELKIDSAESGFKAIDKVKEGNVYDIIFMDHMMPIMDGIEATKKLRELGYKEPIVALTANAVAGQAEIFLENGFDDFISKPIDIRRLNTVLNTFIRDKQPPDVIEAARAQAQMKSEQTSAAAPKLSFSQQIIESFVRDANKSITALQQIIDMGIPLSKDSMKNYIVHTHGMKSALINVGSMELSADAYKLEQSGRDNDIEFISTETPVFLSALRAFVDNLSSHGKAPADDTPDADISDEKEQSLKETLLSIIDSCGVYDEAAIEKTLTGLKDGTWPQHINEVLNRITELLLHSDFDEIVNVVNGYVHK